MHELSIATDIIDSIKGKINVPESLNKVRISASPLSGISYESLTFCFKELCTTKGYTNAILEINIVAVKMTCMQCDNHYESPMLDTYCPVCGNSNYRITDVTPFNIDFIEVEE